MGSSGVDIMLLKFDVPEEYVAMPIMSLKVGLFLASDGGTFSSGDSFDYGFYEGTWDIRRPTYKDISTKIHPYANSQEIAQADWGKYKEAAYSVNVRDALRGGVAVANYAYSTRIGAYYNENSPYIIVEFSDTPIPISVTNSTTVGNKESTTRIKWNVLREDGYVSDIVGSVKQKRATVTWRNAGSQVEHTQQIEGENMWYDFPAGTFLADRIEYKVSVTSNGNATASSAWQTMTTRGVYIAGASPTSGYASELDQIIFGWNIKQDGDDSAVVLQQSAKLFYKNSVDDTEHEISIGTEKYCVVNPPTFTGDVIIWKIRAVATHGTVAESEWYTLSTVEETSSAVAIAPIDVAVDSTKPVLFEWQHIIGTGTITFGFDIQTSTNGSTWTQFAHDERGDIMQDGRDLNRYEAPAGSLSAAVKFWRVRTYNTDMLPGSWSEPATIVVIGAPDAPGIFIIDSSPKWKIRWTQEGQQGYEIQFDGVTLKKGYSLESNYTYDGYAEDGDHEIKVRIQNEYGLWSEWATAAINIQNDPGEPVVLTATVSPDAPEVNLVAAGSDGDSFIYYRDGIEIGRTDQPTFTDRFAIGHATYSVFVTYSDSGNYSASDGVEADVSVKVPWLYSAKTKQWVPLKMSEKETNGLGQSYSITAAFLHFAGSDKPSVEYGVSSDRSMSFSAGFLNDSEDLQKFLAMVGGTVCAKWPDGDMIIGAMFNWERQHGRIYTEFSTKIIETEFDEVAENG